MRTAAVIFIILALTANFYFNNITSLVAAMLSFPLLLVVLLKRKRRKSPPATKGVPSPEEKIKKDVGPEGQPI